jgi:hypothetical protein
MRRKEEKEEESTKAVSCQRVWKSGEESPQEVHSLVGKADKRAKLSQFYPANIPGSTQVFEHSQHRCTDSLEHWLEGLPEGDGRFAQRRLWSVELERTAKS